MSGALITGHGAHLDSRRNTEETGPSDVSSDGSTRPVRFAVTFGRDGDSTALVHVHAPRGFSSNRLAAVVRRIEAE